MHPTRPEDENAPLSVGALNRLVKDLLDRSLGPVMVEGEVSRVTRAPSGHVYFALKDEDSRIDAVIWRDAARSLRAPLVEGQVVIARGQVTVYPPQGKYQLVVQSVRPSGEGALRAAFLRLKEKLEAEGLTAPARKRPLPFLPRGIGIVTSPTGAALQDLLQVIWRRFPRMPVVLSPTRVQGEGAALEIRRALELCNSRTDVDVVIVARGGGSREDLWTFNDEGLARAIAASRLPVISAVGHEIDVSIADLVADLRALTPTEAGERATPELAELAKGLLREQDALVSAIRRRLADAKDRVVGFGRRRALASFLPRLAEEMQGLDLLLAAATRGMSGILRVEAERLSGLGRTLGALRPRAWIRERRTALSACGQSLFQSVEARMAAERARLSSAQRALFALNPLAVLGRGFSLVLAEGDGKETLVRSGDAIAQGQRLRLVFGAGPDREALAGPPLDRLYPAPAVGGNPPTVTIPAGSDERSAAGEEVVQGEDGGPPGPRGRSRERGPRSRGGDRPLRGG